MGRRLVRVLTRLTPDSVPLGLSLGINRRGLLSKVWLKAVKVGGVSGPPRPQGGLYPVGRQADEPRSLSGQDEHYPSGEETHTMSHTRPGPLGGCPATGGIGGSCWKVTPEWHGGGRTGSRADGSCRRSTGHSCSPRPPPHYHCDTAGCLTPEGCRRTSPTLSPSPPHVT